MGDTDDEWRPGSFTKNFGWGVDGLGLLHRALRAGFADEEKDVPRRVFMDRLRQARLIEFIPANFFLFNRPIGGIDHIIFDELAFQAVTNPHSPRFDKLALCAFNFSYVGRWASARQHQKRPALWAFNYIRQRVAGELHWDTKNVNADDIERLLRRILAIRPRLRVNCQPTSAIFIRSGDCGNLEVRESSVGGLMPFFWLWTA